MTRIIILAGVLFILASAPGAGAQTSEKTVRMLDVHEARTLLDRGQAMMVDVRNSDAYSERHVAGAISIPLLLLSNRTAEFAASAQIVIFYCACVADASSLKAANQLAAVGVGGAAVLKGGWAAWNEAGFATKPGPLP